MRAATLKALQEARAARLAVVLATRLADGKEALVFADSASGDLADDQEVVANARIVLGGEASRSTGTSGGRVFLHVFSPPPRLIVVGAVHIAQALVPMAAMAGYDVIVVDPRRAFASDERFPNVTVSRDWPDEALAALKPDSGTAVVTLTHDPKLDDPALAAALKSDCVYIGALGSRKTHEKRLVRLAELGFGRADFARIHGPVGLSIGALSPAEIAISILAQITLVRRLFFHRDGTRVDADAGQVNPDWAACFSATRRSTGPKGRSWPIRIACPAATWPRAGGCRPTMSPCCAKPAWRR
jgi:xanthine dehydrogenase accessory factor